MGGSCKLKGFPNMKLRFGKVKVPFGFIFGLRDFGFTARTKEPPSVRQKEKEDSGFNIKRHRKICFFRKFIIYSFNGFSQIPLNLIETSAAKRFKINHTYQCKLFCIIYSGFQFFLPFHNPKNSG